MEITSRVRRLLSILLLLIAVLPMSGKNKERITERGSSLFYRSWRYPVVEEKRRDTMQVEKLPVDSVAEDVTPQDSTPILDSIPMDTIPQDALTDLLTPAEKLAKDSIHSTAATADGDDSQHGAESDMPKVVRPDINTCIVYFIFDQSNFIRDYKAEFDTIMAFIDYHRGKDFEVIGHTDERGTVQYNQGLSERRAKKVFDVLVGRGVDPKRLTRIGRSELELAIPHAKNEREHLLNRRVVVRVKER